MEMVAAALTPEVVEAAVEMVAAAVLLVAAAEEEVTAMVEVCGDGAGGVFLWW